MKDDIEETAEDYFFRLQEWLEKHGRTSGDVMEDEEGGRYVLEEVGDEGRMKRVYVPVQGVMTVEEFVGRMGNFAAPKPKLQVMDKVRTPRGWIGTITQWEGGLAKVMSRNVLGEWTSCLFNPDDLARV